MLECFVGKVLSMKQRLFATLLFCVSVPQIFAAPRHQLPPESVQTDEADRDIRDLQYAQLEELLKTMPEGVDRSYFEGILANRAGQMRRSERLLREAIPHLTSNEGRRKALGVAALADDYLKLFRYKDAALQYSILLNQYPRDIDAAVLAGIRDDFGIIQLIADYPPQGIERMRSGRLKTVTSPLGTFDVMLTVNGVQAPWILDTGANFSLVSASFAKQLGIKVSEQNAQTKGGMNGFENTVRVALLPKLELQGTTIRNVVLLVFDDRSLNIAYGPTMSYQIKAILGYPIFQMLGAATFTADGYFETNLSEKDSHAFSRMFMNKLTPLVEAVVEGRKLLFVFDTGATGSEFTKRYYEAFPAQFRNLTRVPMQAGGAGGGKMRDVYRLPQATIQIGGRTVVLHKVPVATSLYGTELDDSFGNLGRDIAAPFASFTIDLSNMRFNLGRPVSSAVGSPASTKN